MQLNLSTLHISWGFSLCRNVMHYACFIQNNKLLMIKVTQMLMTQHIIVKQTKLRDVEACLTFTPVESSTRYNKSLHLTRK